MTGDSARTRRLEAFRRLLLHARERLGLDIGLRLWDGSRIPADHSDDALTLAIADENAVAALIRRPNAETLAHLWVAKRIDILNGTVFDLVARRPTTRTKAMGRSLDKGLALGTAAKFLFLPRGGPWPLDERQKAAEGGDPAANRRNVSYHYDVSNAFYALWLDAEMVYTCGYATRWDAGIDEMQSAKLEHICRKLRLAPGERLLDIGCGWGALVCHAALHHGVTAHGVTLSEEQAAYAREKVKRLGLEDRVTIELKDFSLLEGRFDKITSVGMQEHIRPEKYEDYYRTVRRLLEKNGLYFHQAITRPAKRPKRFRRHNAEFRLLTKYIFPGGELDNIGSTIRTMELCGFEVHDVEDLREHYARTCRLWHDRLFARYADAVAEVGEPKTRAWLLYLAGCSIAFERGTVMLYQSLASPRKRGPSGLPPTRADLYGR